ncbi:MAG: tRNA (adenosine(37)-N6)-threonylcarbamoyltransferase complex dimerization subunit type 1 TsaB [Cyanobium sp. NAT70]|nr:tRNA (adenosine(37)-N6)-threonylcarbamoyltransferase complex dimerization subunit type 1 TsaB [Cyanobium sp. NAT70]|tara:strand:- start:7024 stop:7644 length:621 start_codon:yes stop_codon:yes gene_type:complete
MSRTPLLLALHSTSQDFGVAVLDPLRCDHGVLKMVFPDGRGLSNSLISRIDALLDKERWMGLEGLAVATGPGGFTGTRLSVVLARSLAQQLGCPLLGVSSYALMAARLACQLPPASEPFWIRRDLPRRGQVVGCYRVQADQVEELERPQLQASDCSLGPRVVMAEDDVDKDVARLLQLLRDALARGEHCPWQSVLPIYPTSPVGPV